MPVQFTRALPAKQVACMPAQKPASASAAGVQKAMTLVKYSQPYEVTEHELPIPVGTEVLIRTTYAGLCHSELHMWEGKFNLGGGQSLDSSEDQLPCVLGHEIEGEVLAAGDAVPEGFLGNNYAVFPWIGCDKPDCTYCGEGWENLCNKPDSQCAARLRPPSRPAPAEPTVFAGASSTGRACTAATRATSSCRTTST